MADRSVAVKLMANVQGFVSGMRTAQKAAGDFATKGLDRIGAHEQSIQTLTTGVGALGLAMVGFAGLAVSKFADFDQAMSNVQASTMESAANMELLREAALEAGARTVYSATEAAGAIENLAKAGVSTADILGGGLDGALDLAAAGGLAVADAAEIAASAMTQFGLEGSDVTHVADLLAAGAGKAQGGVQDLGAALNQSGLVAAQMGLSVEETVGSLTAFAEAGLTGSDAGTSFRAMLLRLANPTGKSAELMEELGLSVYSASGEFIGMEALAGQLQERLGGLSQEQRNAALATIFGQDAIRTSAILYEQGAEGVAEWTAAVDDQGYAAQQAAMRLDNLKGDLEELGGAFETWLIRMGEGGDGALRTLVQGVTAVVEEMGELPPAAQQAMLAIAGGGGLALLGIAGLGKLAIGINDARLALKDLGVSAKTAGRAVAGITAGFAVATAAVAAWASEAQRARAMSEQLAGTLDDTADATADTEAALRDMLAETRNVLGISFDSAYTEAEKMGISFETLTEYVLGSADAVEEVNAAGDEFIAGSSAWEHIIQSREGSVANLTYTLDTMRDSLTDAQRAELQKIEADRAAEQSSSDFATATQDASDALGINTEALEDNTAAAQEAAGVVLSVRDAQRNLEDAVDTASDSIEENGRTLDVTTQAGRRNQTALDNIASSGWDLIDSMRATGASQEELQDTMRDTRSRFIDAAESMGMSTREAKALADQLGLIPENVDADVNVNTAAAERQLEDFINRRRHLTIQARVNADPNYSPARSQNEVYRASGGPVTAQQGYWVGESGPEWFTPSSTGMITNASASRSLYGSDAMVSPAAPVVNVSSGGGGDSGMRVDKVYVTTASSGFSLEQVRERLRMAGAS